MNKALRILLMASFSYFLASSFSACVQNKEDKTIESDSIPATGEVPNPTKKDGVVVLDTVTKKSASPPIESVDSATAKKPVNAKPIVSKKIIKANRSQKEPLDTAFINKQKLLQAEALERARQLSIERVAARKLAKEKAAAALAAAAQLKAEALEKSKLQATEKQLKLKVEKARRDSIARENMSASAKLKALAQEKAAQEKAEATERKKAEMQEKQKAMQEAKTKADLALKEKLEAAEEKRINTINQKKQEAAERIRKLTEARMKSDSLAKAGVQAGPKPIIKGKTPVVVKKAVDIQAAIDADAKQKEVVEKSAETKPEAGLKEGAKNDTLRDNLQSVKKEEAPEIVKKKEVLAPLNYPTDKKYEKLIDEQIYYASEIRKDHLPEKFKVADRIKLQKVTASIDSMKLALNPNLAPERKPELLKMDDRAELASMMLPIIYAHEIGSMVYGLGVSYMGPDYSFPLVLTADKACNAQFSFGGYLGYFRENILEQGPPKNNSVYSFNSVNYSYSYYCLGARGTYHLLNPQSFIKLSGLDRMVYDLYTTASIGYNMASSPLAAIENDSYKAPQKNGLNYGLSLGLRYMIDDKLGAFAEAGYSRMGFVTLGISYSYRKTNKKITPVIPEDKPVKTTGKPTPKIKQSPSKNKKK